MIVRNANNLVENARTSELNRARKILVEVVDSAIKAGNPTSSIKKWITLDTDKLKIADCEVDLNQVGKIVVAGGGKAGVVMARAIEDILSDLLSEGIVNIPEGTMPSAYNGKIKFMEVRHPIPSEAGVESTRNMLSLLQKLGERDLAIFVISGGGSAIIPFPAEGITLAQLQEVTRLLLRSGATINELNVVRKHLSAVKGGQLARAAYPAQIVTLLISDVVGDSLDTIASGPTYWDSTTFSDALAVLEKFNLIDKVPVEVLRRLRDGSNWLIPETPNRGDECFRKACYKIIASNMEALEAAKNIGISHGLNVITLTTKLNGNARDVGQKLSYFVGELIKEGKQLPCLLLLGGETTVQVTGKGIGGRNQEIALSTVSALAELKNVALVSFSTDGIDGPTDAAGAIVDEYSLQRAKELGLDPERYLLDNDSYHFFEKLGDLVLTGPTGTNIVDCTALLIQ